MRKKMVCQNIQDVNQLLLDPLSPGIDQGVRGLSNVPFCQPPLPHQPVNSTDSTDSTKPTELQRWAFVNQNL